LRRQSPRSSIGDLRMKLNKIAVRMLILIFMLLLSSACLVRYRMYLDSGTCPAYAERLVATVSVWGGFLANVTGSRAFIENLGKLPQVVRMLSDFASSDMSALRFFVDLLVFLLGFDAESPLFDGAPFESYSI